MARLNDLKFDTAHWQLVSGRARERIWANDRGDTLSQMLWHGPPGIPVVGAAQAFGEQLRMTVTPAEGEVLSVEEREAVGTRVILAFAFRREGMGRTYTAQIFVPFSQFSYLMLVECPEYGITGFREALQACGQSLGHDTSGSEFDTALDRVLPDHPHHRCRVYLNEVLASLRASPALLGEDPWPPSRLRLSGITLQERQLLIRDELGRVLHELPFPTVRRFDVRRRWKFGALPFIAAGLLGINGAWFWMNSLWAGLTGLAGLLMFVGGLTAVYPWQLEIETNDGTLVKRKLIGTTTWERAGLREHFTVLLATLHGSCNGGAN